MLKSYIDVLKCGKAKASDAVMRSQISENLRKMKKFKIF